jgi:hypothetical protein
MAARAFLVRSALATAAFVAILLLASSRAQGQVLRTEWLGSQDAARFGHSVAVAGDVDGDGVEDLLVGESLYDGAGTDSGRLHVYSGGSFALLRTHDGAAAGDQFGYACAGIGDLDQDGFSDYVVAAPWFDAAAGVNCGRVHAISGQSGGALWTADGAKAGALLGQALAGIADMDADGRPEVLAGAPAIDAVYVLDMTGAVTKSFSPSVKFSGYGSALARTGDVDLDGHDDFMISDPFHSTSLFQPDLRGRVEVRSGASGAKLFEFIGDTAGYEIGRALAGIHDADLDGRPDLLVTGQGVGVDIILIASGKDGSTIFKEMSTATGYRLGFAATAVPDFDFDGVPDFAVSVADSAGVPMVRVYSGDALAEVAEIGESSPSGDAVDFGNAIGAADWNGDGIGDLLIADDRFAVTCGGGTTRPGAAFLVLGCPAYWRNYGDGWPGWNGVPGFVSLVAPAVGAPIDLQIDNSLGATTLGLMLAGLAQASTPTNAGGTLLLDPIVMRPLNLPANGLTYSNQIPDDPALYCLDLFAQVLELDPSASKGISFTQGLRLHCGFDLP